ETMASGQGPAATSIDAVRAIYDPLRDRMIVLSRVWGGAPTPEIWSQSMSLPGRWDRLAAGGMQGPLSAEAPSVLYDPLRDRMIVFGGWVYGAESPNNAVGALSLGALSWSRIEPTGSPPAGRYRHCAVYDPIRDRMVVLGGGVLGNYQTNETWELSLADPPTWRQLSFPHPLPPPLWFSTAVAVPERDWIMVHGGFYGSTPTSDVWVLEGGKPAAPACRCPGTVAWTADRRLSARYALSHPLESERRLTWTLRSDRAWPGFPMHGSVIVAAAASETVAVDVAVPDSATGGANRLSFGVSFAGADGEEVSCTHEIVDWSTATLASLIAAEA